MDKSDESKKTKKQQGKLNTSLRRRALVKGSAAVLPTIFTLRSGAVLAQVAGESLTCAGKIPPPGPEGLIVTEQDQLVRIPAFQRNLTTGAGEISVYRRSDATDGAWVTEEDGTEWEDTIEVDGQMQQALNPAMTGTFAAGTDTEVFILACPDDLTTTTDGPPLFCATPEVTTPSCMASLAMSEPGMGE